MPKHGMSRPFTPRNPRLVACPEMWHHYVFDRAINTTGLSPAGSQNCRLLHLGGTLNTHLGNPCREGYCTVDHPTEGTWQPERRYRRHVNPGGDRFMSPIRGFVGALRKALHP